MEKMGISFFSKSVMDFFYKALQKIKEQHLEDDNVCLPEIYLIRL